MELAPRKTPTASILPILGGWRLYIQAGGANAYRLAQLDDYACLPRSRFAWGMPLAFSLEARVSAQEIPGTWGFGLWNDPFGFSLGFGGNALRLPCLPNAAWFFQASPENHLSFRDDQPARGFLVQTFCSPRIPSPLLMPGILGLPFLSIGKLSRLARRLVSKLVQEDTKTCDAPAEVRRTSEPVSLDVTQWHAYSLEWSSNRVAFAVDQVIVLETPLAPRGPLGVVIWIDNQYAAWKPDGRFGFGVLESPEAWLEIKNFRCI
jgi:hypothetical protein